MQAQSKLVELPSRDESISLDASSRRGHILLVADGDIRAHVYNLLTPFYDVTIISDGAEAIRSAIEATPHLILADVAAIQTDGRELLSALSTNGRRASIPILVLSTDAVLTSWGERSNVVDVVDPYDSLTLLGRVGKHLATSLLARNDKYNEKSLFGEAKALDREGIRIELSHADSPNRNEAGRSLSASNVARDVGERPPAAAGPAKNDDRIRTFARNVPVAIFIKDLEGRYTLANPLACEALGRPEGAIGLTDHDLLPTDVADQLRERDLEVISTGHPSQRVDVVARDGFHRDFLTVKFPLIDSEGRTVGVCGVATDITERKREHEVLCQSEERFRTLASHAPVGIFMSSSDGQTVFVNEKWCAMTGLTSAQATGNGWTMALHPEDRMRVVGGWKEAVRRGVASNADFRFLRPDGEVTWLQGSAVPLRDSTGHISGFIGTVMDISERKRAEEELRQADRRKDEFLAVLAHELRNPLAPIRTGLELMRSTEIDREVAEDVRSTMERQVEHMVRLVDDLLDVSRITRGIVELHKCRIDLASVVRSAIETSRPAIDELKHQLSVSLPDQSVTLDADPTRLAQVISNLLNNAAKFMDAGGNIEIGAWLEGDTSIVTVKDSGIGIPAEMLNRVFDMFTQIDQSRGRPHSGLGIGLTLVRQLVEMHGGAVEARSAGLGLGSEFVIRLPVAKESLRPDQHDEDEFLRYSVKRRILVADDNESAARLLAMLLTSMGNEVRTAHDGQAALNVASKFRPELVLLDLDMPKLDGYETARKIRNEPWGKEMVLAALTGWGQEEDKRRTKDAGFDHHFIKPISPNMLQRLLVD